jgi:hypothetical protein
MNRIKDFFLQQIFVGFYANYANKQILKAYNSGLSFDVDVTQIAGKEDVYIEQIKGDLKTQLERKIRIEDKAKSLLFIISVVISAITFSLSYLNSLLENEYQIISVSLILISIICFVFGAIRSLQSLNIRKFHVGQSEIELSNNSFVIKPNPNNVDLLKDIIKSKQLNDLINIQCSNYAYASFTLIRNGIIFFVLFFFSTIFLSYIGKLNDSTDFYAVNKEIKVKLNDSIHVNLPYTFQIKYNVEKLKIDKTKRK